MPSYRYYCDKCYLYFETYSSEEKNEEFAPCKKCKKDSERVLNVPMIGRTGTDRETADIVIGKESEKRWEGIKERKAQTEKIRKETGNVAVGRETKVDSKTGQINYEYKTVDKDHVEERKKLYSDLRKRKKSY